MARAWRRRYDPDDPVLKGVLDGIAHLPEAGHEETWGVMTLRVRRRLFGVYGGGLAGEGRWLIFKPVPSERAALAADPRIGVAPHFKLWLELDLDAVADWSEVRELLTDSYALAAPAELAARAGGRPV
ncbi:MAG: MmcQ/YjbR family DNA-binding protein [Bifidobacteriaceae bacterium]|jgi:predicted DNA-binding protein (MmcQ/YjbR family)|nr:MmcQ/YjbR family DNA-binding protein [Bifidobacteriaceae bacterium]